VALSDTGHAARPSARTALAGLAARARALIADGSDGSLARRLAGTAFLVRVASAVLAYGSQILLARWMGGYEFGIYVYVWTWVLLIGGIVDLGLGSATPRFVPEFIERKELALLRGFLAGSRWLSIGLATIFTAACILGVRALAPWLDRDTVIPLYIACVALPIYGLLLVQSGIARSYNWVNLALMPAYVVRQVILLALMAGAYFAGLPTDAVTATTVAVISVWAVAVGQLLVLNRRLGETLEKGPKSFRIGSWLAISAPLFAVEGFYLLLTYADVLVLKQFRPADEVAVYYASAKTLALVAFIYFSVAQTIGHKFTEYHVSGNRERLADFLAHAVRLTFWPSLAAIVVLLAIGQPMLLLFGQSFVAGYHLMFIIAVGMLARAAVGPAERLLNMLGEQRACALVYAGAFAVNITLCLVLIPPYGAVGAASAVATALVVESTLLFLVAKRRLGLHSLIIGRPKAR
jgi:O-antigen/teichoic acid export membrane protein